MKALLHFLQRYLSVACTGTKGPSRIPASLAIAACTVLFNLSSALGNPAGGQRTQIEVVWQHKLETGPLPLHCHGTPAIGNDGSIYVPAGNFLYALNPDGSEKWRLGKENGLQYFGDVAIDDKDTIYVMSDALYAYRSNRSMMWRIPGLREYEARSVAIGKDGFIYFMRNGNLCATDAQGTVNWERQISGDPSFAPVIGPDGTIYAEGIKAGPGTARIHAFDREGRLKWTFETDAFPALTSAAVDDLGVLYFGPLPGNLYALDRNGQLKWVFKTDRGLWSAPAIGQDHTIYFGCEDGNFYAVNPNGELKWKFAAKDAIGSAPAIDGQGNIYFASRDGNFYCLDPNGSPKSVLRVGAGFGNPVIGAGGTIYLPDVGCLYAIRGLAGPSAVPWPMKRHDAQGTGRCSSHDNSVSTQKVVTH